ncbi:MAG: hypothetical protein VW835_23060 [Rickettsiales bacterium]
MALCATLVFCVVAAARDVPVVHELVLAVDVLGSVDEVEAGL